MKRLFLALAILIPSFAAAQATPFVAPSDPVYRHLDNLAAAGLLRTYIVGVRPLTEREILRLLGEARGNLDARLSARGWAQTVLAADIARFTRGAPRAIDAAMIEGTAMRSPSRGIPPDGSGFIDAAINPLAADRGGRPIADGATVGLETQHSLVLGSHLALSLNPRLTFEAQRGSVSGAALRLQSGAADFLFGNLSLSAGRDYAIFGQSPAGGLMLSENAPAFDMVRLSNDAPLTLPWWLRALGPMRGTAFIADLGAHQFHPHAKLAAYKVAALPSSHFEIGVEVDDAMGGNGGQPASFGDRILDALAIPDVFRKHSDFQFSNKMAGADVHWRMPSWHGFDLYEETVIDDFDARRLRSVFLDDGGYLAGIAFSCITECGRLGVRAEYHQTGIRFYTHGDYPLAENGLVLGDPLGPRGLGAYLTVDGESSTNQYYALTGAFEVRSGNLYGSAQSAPNAAGFHFIQLAHRPGEKRARILGTWMPELGDRRLSLRATAGLERVTNFGFVAGSDRTNVLASLGLVVRP
ncbi:MAG TPA: capsule assembly Wzi family protein [Gemmatimonadaceae bacterium]